MHTTLRLASAVAASALLVGGLSACSSSKSTGTNAAPAASGTAATGGSAASGGGSADGGKNIAGLAPKEALLASAAVMEKAGSAKLVVSDSGNAQSGTGMISWKSPQGFELSSKSDGPEVKIRVVGEAMFIGMDDQTAATLGGKHWLKLDQKASGGSDTTMGGEDLGSITSILNLMNPVVQLTASAKGGRLSKIGAEKVDGVDTVHYQSKIPVGLLVDAMTGLSADLKKKVLDDLTKQGSTGTIDFWINAKGELVQEQSVSLNAAKGAAAAAAQGAATVKYTELGSTGTVQAPAAADTLDAGDMLKSLGNLGGH